MSTENSQEQMIYRSLAGRIQLGFFDDGERFPSAQELARHFGVSYCPVQRALKSLERSGLVRLCRGRQTVVLGKPYDDYLRSPVFASRASALADLNESLRLISAAICCEALPRMPSAPPAVPPATVQTECKLLYLQFRACLDALGNQIARSLYYDAGAFAGSAYLDILCALDGPEDAARYLHETRSAFAQSAALYAREPHAAQERLQRLSTAFSEKFQAYLAGVTPPAGTEPAVFCWEPHKGRTRYCDLVATDLICKIHQGIYPVGTLLPHGPELADVYHVSAITIRRSIALLNRLGVTRTQNGVGTRVTCAGDASLRVQLSELMFGENLRAFLEALQLIAVTCGPVLEYTFPHCTEDARRALAEAAAIPQQKKAMVAVLSAVMQTIVRDCPLAAIREIYSKLTLTLLKGSILRIGETGGETVPGWPALAQALRAALAARDGARVAATFRRLAECCFLSTRQDLIELGIPGIETLTCPRGQGA